jgi:hypothetical protein
MTMKRRALRIGAVAVLTVTAVGIGMLTASAVMQVWAYSDSKQLTVGSVPPFAAAGSVTCTWKANSSGTGQASSDNTSGQYVLAWERPPIPAGVNLANYTITTQTTQADGGGLLGANYDFADGDWLPRGKWGAVPNPPNMKALDSSGNPYKMTGSGGTDMPYLRFPNSVGSTLITYSPPTNIQGSMTTTEENSTCQTDASRTGCIYNVTWGVDVGSTTTKRTLGGTITIYANYTFDSTDPTKATVVWASPKVTAKYTINVTGNGVLLSGGGDESGGGCTVTVGS